MAEEKSRELRSLERAYRDLVGPVEEVTGLKEGLTGADHHKRRIGYKKHVLRDKIKVRLMDHLLEMVSQIDLAPIAELLKAELQRRRVEDHMGGRASLREDGGDIYLEVDVPLDVYWDDRRDVLVCRDAALAHLIQIVTGGEKREIKALLRGRESLRKRILRDRDGMIRATILAHALQRGMEKTDRDPLEWMKLARELIEGVKDAPKHKRGDIQVTPSIGRILGLDAKSRRAKKGGSA